MTIISLGMILTNACVDLETQPTDRIVSEFFWKIEQDALMAVNGVYSLIPAKDYIYLDCASDIAWNQSSFDIAHLMGNGSQTANDKFAIKKWKSSYEIIQRVNTVLENIGRVDNIDETLRNRLISEVRFIRAMTYSDMIFLWGDVPLVKTTLDIITGYVSRSPKSEVLDFVIDELKNITSTLPEKYDNINTGRVTKGAAMTLLMRVYLRQNMYSETIEMAKEIMDINIYSLYPDYESLFKYVGENSKEIIFDKQFISTTYNHDLSKVFSPRSAFGSSYIVPLKNLVDSYQMINGYNINSSESGYDPYNPYIDRDPRLKATILVPGDLMYTQEIFNPLPDQNPVGTNAVDNPNTLTSKTGFNFKKYVNPEDIAESNSNSFNNLIILRYAEVLLSYAEAKIEFNKIDESVYKAINDIRLRAGMPIITVGKSQDQLREIVRLERKVEFPLEGLRYFDIRRWSIAEQVIPGRTYGITYINKKNELDTLKAEMRYFNASRDYLWPIPEREINVNSNLIQNPLY